MKLRNLKTMFRNRRNTLEGYRDFIPEFDNIHFGHMESKEYENLMKSVKKQVDDLQEVKKEDERKKQAAEEEMRLSDNKKYTSMMNALISVVREYEFKGKVYINKQKSLINWLKQ